MAASSTSASDQSSITTLFEQVLGRDPQPSELTYWTNALLSGESLTTIRSTFAFSSEAQSKITTVIAGATGQPPSAAQLTAVESQLAVGSTTFQQFVTQWTPQAQNLITTLFEQVLGHDPQPSELTYWTNALLSGESLTTIRSTFASCAEAQSKITAVIAGATGQPPSAVQVAAVESQLTSGLTFQQFVAQWTPQAQNLITTLFEQVLGRDPQSSELTYWTNALLSGKPLSVIRSTFAFCSEAQSKITAGIADATGLPAISTEVYADENELVAGAAIRQLLQAQSQIAQNFEQVLGRSPQPSELIYWTNALLSGETLSTIRSTWATCGEARNKIAAVIAGATGQPPSAGQLTAVESQLAAGSTTFQQFVAQWTPQAQNLITTLFEQVLGRDPQPSELTYWTNALLVDEPLSIIRSTFAFSSEAQAKITTVIAGATGQPPSAAQLTAVESQLAVGSTTFQQFVAQWTPQAQNLITTLFEQVLGHDPQPSELTYWTNALLSGESLSTIRTTFATCGEAQSKITAVISGATGQPPSAAQVTAVENQLASGLTFQQFVAQWTPQAQNLITTLFEQVLGRDPQPSELTYWTNALLNGEPLSTIRTTFATCGEAQSEISAAFASDTGQPPSAAQVTAVENQLASGLSIQQLLQAQSEVTQVIEQVLGRDPQPSELTYWTNALLNGEPLSTIRTTFATCGEAQSKITAVISGATGQPPSAAQVTAVENQLASGLTFQQFVTQWTPQAESLITATFEQVLGRDPQPSELTYWTNALLDGEPLSTIRTTFATCGEAQSKITEVISGVTGQPPSAAQVTAVENQLASALTFQQFVTQWTPQAESLITATFEQVLGRDPQPSELTYWTNALLNGEPLSTIRTTFVSCAEGQSDINAVFNEVLDEAPTSAEMSAMSNEITAGLSLQQLTTILEETQQISVLSADINGIAPTAGSFLDWETALAGGETPFEIRGEIVESSEGVSYISTLLASESGSAPTGTVLASAEQNIAAGESIEQLRGSLDSAPAPNPTVWLSANDPVTQQVTGKTGTEDYDDLFSGALTPSSAQAIAGVSVLIVPYQFFEFASDAQLENLFQYLSENDIALATYGETLWRGPQSISALSRIAELGGNLQYFLMDEPLYWGHQSTEPGSPQLSISQLASVVAGDVAVLKSWFPTIEVGDSDPVPTTDDLSQWFAAYQADTGSALSFFAADVQWSTTYWLPGLEQAAQLVRSNGITFDVFFTGDPATTNSSWVQDANNLWTTIEADPLIRPGAGIISSWSDFPTDLFPGSDPDTLSNVLLLYEIEAPLLQNGILAPVPYPAPFISSPQEVLAALGTNVNIQGIELGLDPSVPADSNVSIVLISDSGNLAVTDNTALSISGSGSSVLTLTGQLADVNKSLTTLTFAGTAAGSGNILLEAFDGSGPLAEETISIPVFGPDSGSSQVSLQALSSATLGTDYSIQFLAPTSTVASAGAGPEAFIITGNTPLSAVINNFDISQDIIVLPKSLVPDMATLDQDLSSTSGGTLLTLSSTQTVLVPGVDSVSLTKAGIAIV